MRNIGFFTSIKYDNPQTFSNSLLNKVDNYFYLGGKKAHVLQGLTKDGREKVILSDTNSSKLARFAKVISYFTFFIPLAMLLLKVALRYSHSFKLIDPRAKLEKGLTISEETRSKLRDLMPKIRSGEEDDEIEWLSKGQTNNVFKIAGSPDLVFKIPRHYDGPDPIDERFAAMVKGKEVCLANKLGLLVIPHAKIVEVEGYALIAEEKLDIAPNNSAQEEFYHKFSTELNETARQLAIFIAKTGFSDVIWRNIPLINEADDFHGNRRVGLIDIENMESAFEGFVGGINGSCGLIRCVTEEQIDLVIAEAKKQGVAISDKKAKELKELRLKELESDKKLREVYEKNHIVDGHEPIQVDVESLGLDLSEEGTMNVIVDVKGGEFKLEKQKITLRKVTEDVIAEINKSIQKASEEESIKGKRSILLSTNDDPIRQYWSLGLPHANLSLNGEQEKKLWLRRIIQALIDKGHLVELLRTGANGYYIQA